MLERYRVRFGTFALLLTKILPHSPAPCPLFSVSVEAPIRFGKHQIGVEMWKGWRWILELHFFLPTWSGAI
jgi:hypothetical protein